MPKFNQLQTEIVPLVGGVNMVTPQILVKPGTCIFASNFEPDISGGYRRIKGIERFDGHKSPSTMDYKIVEGYIIEALQVGDRIGGTDSGANLKQIKESLLRLSGVTFVIYIGDDE